MTEEAWGTRRCAALLPVRFRAVDAPVRTNIARRSSRARPPWRGSAGCPGGQVDAPPGRGPRHRATPEALTSRRMPRCL